jgi:hypothetical protein
MTLAEHEIESICPIRQKDLVYPVLRIASVESDDTADTIKLEAVLRSEGEPVQRHVLTYRIGRENRAA